MKWHEMYGRHEVVWTLKGSGKTQTVDLFRLGHILHLTAGVHNQIKVCHAVGRVCEIVSEAQADRFYRYLSVVNSVRGQSKTAFIMALCKARMDEKRGEKEEVKAKDRQLVMEF